ncbi:MAG: leucine-rich repeat protein, partial [Clostridiales bacterium]|nr:leucine-rich repeat protein [Clostridiales bacterium]
MKRILSMVLTISLAFSIVATPALATDDHVHDESCGYSDGQCIYELDEAGGTDDSAADAPESGETTVALPSDTNDEGVLEGESDAESVETEEENGEETGNGQAGDTDEEIKETDNAAESEGISADNADGVDEDLSEADLKTEEESDETEESEQFVLQSFALTATMSLASTSGTGWTLDDDGKLTISSDAGMSDWCSNRTSYNSQVTSVVIESGVTSIASNAFKDCTNLTSVSIGSGVTAIGESAFRACSSLTTVEIPDNVKTIKNNAFYYCTNLTSVSIGNGVETIGEGAFSYCSSLTTVTIPNNVETIGNNAFKNCTNLTSVSIGNGVETIGEGAFSYCSSLTTVTIPNNVETIGNDAFQSCTNLTSVSIGSGVETIEKYAFYDCTSLVDVYYSGSENDWGTISIGDSNTYLTNAFIHYNSSSAHTYNHSTVFNWDSDYSSCTVTVGCDGYSFTKTLNCSVSSTDAAKKILYTAEVTIGIVTYSDTQTVSKIPAPTPTVTVSEVTASSITVTAPSDDNQNQYGVAVYSMDGTTWQQSNVFNNLSAGTSYTVYVKYSGNATYAESEAGSTTVTTNIVVTWVDADGTTVLETDNSVAYGTRPSYDGNTPTKATDDTYIYTFSGWSPEVSVITTNTTYTAVYSKTYVAPAAGAGYAIDYSAETATAASGYEISTDGSTWSSGTLAVIPGGTLYVRRVADTETSASVATENTLASRPGAPDVTAVDEVWYGESDGQITGVTTAMEYSADGSTWIACTGTTVDALAAGTYYVRYRATDSAFTGTAASVTIGSGTERTYDLAVIVSDLAAVTYGYTQSDVASITITSSGNSDATISGVTVNSTNFTIAGSGSTVPAGGSIDTWTIQPAANLNAGTYSDTITVKYNGGATATAEVSFIVNKAAQSISYNADSVSRHINDAAFIIKLTEATVGGGIIYASGNKNVAIVDENSGEVTIVGAGTAIITATATGTDNYEAATAAYTLTVTGHTTEIRNAKDATCTEDGYTGDTVCTVCEEKVATGEVIPATGHTSGEAVKENEV